MHSFKNVQLRRTQDKTAGPRCCAFSRKVARKLGTTRFRCARANELQETRRGGEAIIASNARAGRAPIESEAREKTGRSTPCATKYEPTPPPSNALQLPSDATLRTERSRSCLRVFALCSYPNDREIASISASMPTKPSNIFNADVSLVGGDLSLQLEQNLVSRTARRNRREILVYTTVKKEKNALWAMKKEAYC